MSGTKGWTEALLGRYAEVCAHLEGRGQRLQRQRCAHTTRRVVTKHLGVLIGFGDPTSDDLWSSSLRQGTLSHAKSKPFAQAMQHSTTHLDVGSVKGEQLELSVALDGTIDSLGP